MREHDAAARLSAEVRRRGLLLQSDPSRPSAVGLLAGGPVRGSWWSHPRANAFYATLQRLERHPEVAAAKLLAGKVTYVHARLWPALAGVGAAREPWQVRALGGTARRLLARIDREGEARGTALTPAGRQAARLLERRLLLRVREEHTERGAHAMVLESWPRWCSARELEPWAPDEARAALEAAAEASGASGLLPWQGQSDRNSSATRGGRTSRFMSRSRAS